MLASSIFRSVFPTIFLQLWLEDGVVATVDWTDSSTIGLEFVTVFPWNNENFSEKSKALLSMDFINPHANENAIVQLKYFDKAENSRKEFTVTVPPQSFTEFKFNSTAAIKMLSSENTDIILSSSDNNPIRISSNIPISVLQNNYLPSGVGDSFIVLPTKEAGNYYAFSLPVSPDGNIIVHFLSTESKDRSNTIVIKEPKTEDGEGLKNQNEHTALFESTSIRNEDSITVYARGKYNFQAIVALRRMRINESNTVDYGSTMIPTIPMQNACMSDPINETFDVHISNLNSGSQTTYDYFTILPPMKSCEPSTVNIYGTGKHSEWQIQANQSQKLYSFSYGSYGNEFAIQSSTDLLQMLRFGGSGIKGGYADVVPSLSQYVTGRTGFVVRSATDQVLIIGVPGFEETARLDGQPLKLQRFSYQIGTAYYNTIHLSPGFHVVESTEKYLVYVTGITNNSAYGYTVAMKLSENQSFPTRKNDSESETEHGSGTGKHQGSIISVMVQLAAATVLSKL